MQLRITGFILKCVVAELFDLNHDLKTRFKSTDKEYIAQI